MGGLSGYYLLSQIIKILKTDTETKEYDNYMIHKHNIKKPHEARGTGKTRLYFSNCMKNKSTFNFSLYL